MNRVAPKWTNLNSRSGQGLMGNSCSTAARFLPGFVEPPWTDLNPHLHLALIARLMRYQMEGARVYFGADGSVYRRDDTYYQEEARKFIKGGGRLQYWKTRLVDFGADPVDLVDRRLPVGDQHVIQLRYVVYRTEGQKVLGKLPRGMCNRPTWRGSTFLVTDDLSGPDPHILDGGPVGVLSSSAVLIYQGKPIVLNDGGDEITVFKNWDNGRLAPICTLAYPYYKFNQGE